MALYKEKDKMIKKAYKAYKSRIGNVPKRSIMSFELFKKNYDKTRAKTYVGGRTGSIEKGMRKGNALTYEEAKRFGGRG